MENKLEPQFPAKGLYISPFSLVRTYDTEGVPSYVPLERNLAPTGVKLLDDFLVFLMKGNLSVKTFCENSFVCHIKKQIFNGRGVCVDYEDFHVISSQFARMAATVSA